ncbi:MAG: hypothetical protein P4L50_17395 [Anaerolineaceae bacterium]|nr:hypothetical protein [Anaerolineaceae bacterium]
MPESSVIHCPTCGAPLDNSANQATLRCPYCGSSISVEQAPAGIGDLAREQSDMVNNVMQSAMDMQTKQADMAANVIKSTIPVVVGGTVVLPILIGIITLVSIACVFGIMWLSFGSIFRSLLH